MSNGMHQLNAVNALFAEIGASPIPFTEDAWPRLALALLEHPQWGMLRSGDTPSLRSVASLYRRWNDGAKPEEKEWNAAAAAEVFSWSVHSPGWSAWNKTSCALNIASGFAAWSALQPSKVRDFVLAAARISAGTAGDAGLTVLQQGLTDPRDPKVREQLLRFHQGFQPAPPAPLDF
jgi:hypothetical protein